LANLAILCEQFAEFFFSGIPLGAPIAVHRDAQSDWIGFLAHVSVSSYSSVKTILMWQLRLRIGPAEPRAFGVKRRKVEAVWASASLITRWSVSRSLYSL